MAFNPRAREQFDRERDFLAVRPIATGGKTFGAGEPFDKELVSVRRLRQMYEQRTLRMVPIVVEGSPDKPRAPSLSNLNDRDLRAWLEKRGVIPRRSATRQKLLELAVGLPA